MKNIITVLKKVPGFRSDNNIKKIIASVVYAFIGLILIFAFVPMPPPLAVENPKPSRFSENDIKGKTGMNKPVYLLINGEILAQSKAASNGEFSIRVINLAEGSHTLTVEACYDEKREKCISKLVTLIIDKTPPIEPELNILASETENEKITIEGTGESESIVKILINDNERSEVKASSDGTFKQEITLYEGQNTIRAVGYDLAGNNSKSSNTLTVNYIKPIVQGIQTETVKVTRVIDGDTIDVDINGTIKRVRYIGIDTPETVDPRTSVQCYGKEASNKNKDMVEGKEVRLEKDISEVDKYGRLLRYVWLGETLVNELLVKEGYALSSSYPPDIKYQERLVKAQEDARSNNKGLWGVCYVTPTVKPVTQSSFVPAVKPVTTVAPTSVSYIQPTAVPHTQPTNPPSAVSYSCSGPDLDCPDFPSHSAAQSFFDSCGFSASYDPMRLDGDNDGLACENN